jgi:hypothetical protein
MTGWTIYLRVNVGRSEGTPIKRIEIVPVNTRGEKFDLWGRCWLSGHEGGQKYRHQIVAVPG